MPYLVDGNNVMGQRVGWHRDKAGARKRLIQDLARFLAARKAKVTVVFDGSPDTDFPEGSRYKSVRILYARAGSDADSRVKDLIRRSTNKRNLIVVSSDRELAAVAAGQGARVVPSGKFRKMLNEAIAASPDKPAQSDRIDIDEWLDYFERSEMN
jgi:predicted RNA-binding protein with PIN domain